MDLIICRMDRDDALSLTKWEYEPPYAMYNMTASNACLAELLSGNYYAAKNEAQLIGFYCFGASARIPEGHPSGVYDLADMTDIGLGIKPALCGQGLGLAFLNQGLFFARNELKAKTFRLTVAQSNHRAIKVYENAGFKKAGLFRKASLQGEIEFFTMLLL
jgi:RimJ/RimL family protein N-acetyltransferase